jgi:2-polyprenyl-6-methoxyphenol hydroxylase-like FAD-dependent oxidoreductase
VFLVSFPHFRNLNLFLTLHAIPHKLLFRIALWAAANRSHPENTTTPALLPDVRPQMSATRDSTVTSPPSQTIGFAKVGVVRTEVSGGPAHANVTSKPTDPRVRRVCIVGAGPGGMTAALALAECDVQVVVIEKRQDPRKAKVEDRRSFNLTLGGLGLSASGSLEPAIRAVGQRLIGRRVYIRNRVIERPYGLSADDYFVSIPRWILAAIQVEEAANKSVEIRFEQEVLKANPKTGLVEWRNLGGVTLESDVFDLIIFADGVSGLGRALLSGRPRCSYSKILDSTEYVQAVLTHEDVVRAKLSLKLISFWPSPDGPVVGIPNRDGSVNLLIMGTLPGCSEEEPPFRTEHDAAEYLTRRYPQLVEAAPGVISRLPGVRRGHFCSTSTTRWVVGQRAVVVGDAGRCAPPYAGAGAAAAMSDAKTLVRFIQQEDSLERALRRYEEHRRVASSILLRMTGQHGRFLKADLGSRRWWAESSLKLTAETWFGKRDLYQHIVFDRDGLDRLVASDLNQAVPADRLGTLKIAQDS